MFEKKMGKDKRDEEKQPHFVNLTSSVSPNIYLRHFSFNISSNIHELWVVVFPFYFASSELESLKDRPDGMCACPASSGRMAYSNHSANYSAIHPSIALRERLIINLIFSDIFYATTAGEPLIIHWNINVSMLCVIVRFCWYSRLYAASLSDSEATISNTHDATGWLMFNISVTKAAPRACLVISH